MEAALPSLEAAARLGAALACGLLLGLERGWQGREQPEGLRVAGLRTFALIGFLGGIVGTWGDGAVPAAAGLLGIALLFAVSFAPSASTLGSLSITTAVAALVTFGLGVLAARGQMATAVGAAAVAALLLGFKQELHGGLRRIRPAELKAVLQIGVLSAAILPLLPDAGLGPYGAWNPFRLWLAVVVIASLSLAGHVAMRWRGEQQGLLWVGVLGGLASSTAATLAIARAVKGSATLAPAAAAAAVAACGVMFLRMAVVACALQPALAGSAGAFLVWLGAASFAAAAWQWRRARRGVEPPAQADVGTRVFDLPSAIAFGALLAAVALGVHAAQERFGAAGTYALAFLSGTLDVDAILVSTLQAQAVGLVPGRVALVAIGVAVLANMLAKAALAWFVGGRALGVRVGGGYLAVAAAATGAVLWCAG